MSQPLKKLGSSRTRFRLEKNQALPLSGPRIVEVSGPKLLEAAPAGREAGEGSDSRAMVVRTADVPAIRGRGKRQALEPALDASPDKKLCPARKVCPVSLPALQPPDVAPELQLNLVIVQPAGNDERQLSVPKKRKTKKAKSTAATTALAASDAPPPPKITFLPVDNTDSRRSSALVEGLKVPANPFAGEGGLLAKPASDFQGFHAAGAEGTLSVRDGASSLCGGQMATKCDQCRHTYWGRRRFKKHHCSASTLGTAVIAAAVRQGLQAALQGPAPVALPLALPDVPSSAVAGPEEDLEDSSQPQPLAVVAGEGAGLELPPPTPEAQPAAAGPDVDMGPLPITEQQADHPRCEPGLTQDVALLLSVFGCLSSQVQALSAQVQTLSEQVREVSSPTPQMVDEAAGPAVEPGGVPPPGPAADAQSSANQSPPSSRGKAKAKRDKKKRSKKAKAEKGKQAAPAVTPAPPPPIPPSTKPAEPATSLVPTSPPQAGASIAAPKPSPPKPAAKRATGRDAKGEVPLRDRSHAMGKTRARHKPQQFAASGSHDTSVSTPATGVGAPSAATSDSSADSQGGLVGKPKGFPCPFCDQKFASKAKMRDHAYRLNGCASRDAAREAGLLKPTTPANAAPAPSSSGGEAAATYWESFLALDWSRFLGEQAAMLPVLRKVPFRCRGLALACLRPILRKLKQDPTHLAAGRLLGLFPQLCLSSAGLRNDVPHWKQIRALLLFFRQGKWSELLQAGLSAIAKLAGQVRSHKARSGDEEARNRRCLRFGELAELSRAAEALVAADLAPATEATRAALEGKHPSPTQPFTDADGNCTLPMPPKVAKWALRLDVLSRALRESPRGSAGGPTGWRMDFLRELFTHKEDTKLLGAWLQHAVAGKVGPGVAEWWTASSLVALEKPGGGVRPIAVGEVFPRLLARCLAVGFHGTIVRQLQPKGQFGAGARCGAETVIHGVRAALRANPAWGVLQIDVKNAFNAVCRQALFKELVEGPFVGMAPFLRTLYGAPSPLMYRADATRHTLWSRTGVRQGDPLGPFLYALAQQPALEAVKAAHPDIFMCSYADDTYLLGDLEALGRAFPTLCSKLAAIDLEVSQEKCHWYAPGGQRPAAGNPLTGMDEAKEGLVVVGSPVGSPAFVKAAVLAKQAAGQAVAEALPLIGNAQMASRILAGSVSVRPGFLCRTTPPSQPVHEALAAWDKSMVACFSKILNDESLLSKRRTDRAARMQVALPERLGGFGVQSVARVTDLSYVVSLLSVAGYLKAFFRRKGESIFGSMDGDGSFPPIFEGAAESLQRLPERIRTKLPLWQTCGEKGLAGGTYSALAQELQIDALNKVRGRVKRPAHKARLTSLQLPNAGAWVTALPAQPDLRMSNEDWAIAANLRLGRDIPHLLQAEKCSCGQAFSEVYAPGHALRCSSKYVPSLPHNAIRDHVALVCREAGMRTTVEDAAIFWGKPVPDVVGLHTDSGKTWVLDVVIADPHDNNANCPETKPGAALQEAVRRKHATYRDAVKAAGKLVEKTTKVVPLAIEIYGGWSTSFRDCVRDIAEMTSKRLGQRSGHMADIKPILCHSIAQRIGVTQQRSQAVMIRHRLKLAEEEKGNAAPPAVDRSFPWAGAPPAVCDLVVGRAGFQMLDVPLL